MKRKIAAGTSKIRERTAVPFETYFIAHICSGCFPCLKDLSSLHGKMSARACFLFVCLFVLVVVFASKAALISASSRI